MVGAVAVLAYRHWELPLWSLAAVGGAWFSTVAGPVALNERSALADCGALIGILIVTLIWASLAFVVLLAWRYSTRCLILGVSFGAGEVRVAPGGGRRVWDHDA